jgi:hypothetical protein
MYSRVECEQQNSVEQGGSCIVVLHVLVVGHEGNPGICGLATVRCT